MDAETLIIGGGLAGLNCACHLHAAGHEFLLLEAQDRVGGRVRTDTVVTGHGEYRVDRGFQVLLTAYPHAAEAFDYDALDLCCFYPGAMVYVDGRLHRVADPRRRPGDALMGFNSPVATTRDKIRLAEFSLRVLGGSLEQLWSRPNRTAIEMLQEAGFAQTTIDRFFRPFFGGVFFDLELTTSSRMLEFCYRMFAQGRVCVPADGMGALALQLADRLPGGSVRTHSPVDSVERNGQGWIVRAGGHALRAKNVVVAVEGDKAAGLLGDHGVLPGPVRWRSTATISYDAAASPTDDPVLVLDGMGSGPVNHAVSISRASSRYAPGGRHLIYANVVDPAFLERHGDDGSLDLACRQHLRSWFGDGVDGWSPIRVDRIGRALPEQKPAWLEHRQRPVSLGMGLYACGDWLENASIDGALGSGKRAATAVLEAMSG